jgi:hypothetical protein
MEPIRRIDGPRTGVEGPTPAAGLARVTREQRDADAERRRRRPRPPAPTPPRGVHTGDDGHVHVDIRA